MVNRSYGTMAHNARYTAQCALHIAIAEGKANNARQCAFILRKAYRKALQVQAINSLTLNLTKASGFVSMPRGWANGNGNE